MKVTLKLLPLLLVTLLFSMKVFGQCERESEFLQKTENQCSSYFGNKDQHLNSNRSRYNIPRAASGITTGDIDADGDMDIVVGHIYCSFIDWTGITLMFNNGEGYFIWDSSYFNGQHRNIVLEHLDSNLLPDIITQAYNNVNSQLGIVFDASFQPSDILKFDINQYANDIATGDLNNDGLNDIIFCSSDGKYWCIIKNNGNRNFSSPEYHNVKDYFPNTVATGDLNGDERDDVVVCGQSTEVFFSYPEGFESLVLEESDFKEGAFIVDFDLDGDKDLLTFVGIPIINISVLKMYENLGGGILDTLGFFYFRALSSRSFLSDFNNDSLPDALFTLTDNSGLVLFYNQGNFQMGDSSFIPLQAYQYEGLRNCSFADFDGNGFNDIVITRFAHIQLPDNLVVLFNDGNGNFGEDPVTMIDNYKNINQKSLIKCYPNPFSKETSFEIVLQENHIDAKLNIYDLQSELIRSWQVIGNQVGQSISIKWNGINYRGKECRPGIYIVSLEFLGQTNQYIKIVKIN